MKHLLIITNVLVACLFFLGKAELNNILIASIFLELANLLSISKNE